MGKSFGKGDMRVQKNQEAAKCQYSINICKFYIIFHLFVRDLQVS